MPTSTTERRPLRGEVVAALLLAGCVAIGFGVGQLPKMELTDPSARPLVMRELRFEDRYDGGITVVEYGNDRIIHELEPGDGAFVRSVLRALARERKRMEIGGELPFRMIAWSDGRLSLEDTVTGHRAELNGAFGRDNTAAMIELLYAGGESR
ncbi:MAG: photosynthetic complex assembly protein PuhC [Pseudomonadota bacterium]